MRLWRALFAFAAIPLLTGAAWNGPGRFCGYSPIIDLQNGEAIETLEGGIHGGSFIWKGEFGSLKVHGIGWASKPKGRQLKDRTATGQIRFAERHDEDGFVVAIWNGRQGAAYFRSPVRLTARQISAIDRVSLSQEGERPDDCRYSTVFSWE